MGDRLEDHTSIRLLFIGHADLVDESDDPRLIGRLISELVGENHLGIDLPVAFQPSSGIDELRAAMESGDQAFIQDRPQIVVFSLMGEVERLQTSDFVETALLHLQDDLVWVIEHIKSRIGAHVLVVNVSTLDPTDRILNYHGLEEEPFSLCAHRLNSLLISTSHETGVSVIDVDRVIAERGGEVSVTGPGKYTSDGLERIAEELFRVIQDYGFFDERPVLEQVGARSDG